MLFSNKLFSSIGDTFVESKHVKAQIQRALISSTLGWWRLQRVRASARPINVWSNPWGSSNEKWFWFQNLYKSMHQLQLNLPFPISIYTDQRLDHCLLMLMWAHRLWLLPMTPTNAAVRLLILPCWPGKGFERCDHKGGDDKKNHDSMTVIKNFIPMNQSVCIFPKAGRDSQPYHCLTFVGALWRNHIYQHCPRSYHRPIYGLSPDSGFQFVRHRDHRLRSCGLA